MSETKPKDPPNVSLWTRLGRLALATLDIYAGIAALLLLLRVVTGYRLWPLVVTNYLLHLILLPCFVILLVMVWRKRWPRAALAGVGALGFIILYGGLFLPRLSSRPACASGQADCSRHMTVMTFNLAAGDSDDDSLVAALENSGAEIIGLQEMGAADAALIRERLSDEYPYQVQHGDGIPGIGLISRHPITHYEIITPPTVDFPFILAVLDVDGQPLTVLVAHPPPPGIALPDRRFASRTIFDVPLIIDLTTGGGPALVLADLNIPDQSEEYELLRAAGLNDSWREAGWGFGLTFPAAVYRGILPPIPLWRIDYILHTDDFYALRAWRGPITGSDHRPVLAELVWMR